MELGTQRPDDNIFRSTGTQKIWIRSCYWFALIALVFLFGASECPAQERVDPAPSATLAGDQKENPDYFGTLLLPLENQVGEM
jgi:hypothetical protein